MVIYSNFPIPKGFAGITLGPFIFIRPKYKADKGLLEHEKVHVRQFWQMFPFFHWFYLFDKVARLNLELEAYREQLKWCENKEASADHFAERIANGYRLNVDRAKVKAALCATMGLS